MCITYILYICGVCDGDVCDGGVYGGGVYGG